MLRQRYSLLSTELPGSQVCAVKLRHVPNSLLVSYPTPEPIVLDLRPKIHILSASFSAVRFRRGDVSVIPSFHKLACMMHSPSGHLNGSTDFESCRDEDLVKTLKNAVKTSRIQSRISESSQELQNLFVLCRANLCHPHAPTRRPA
jgi:hypothetical protein